MRTTITLPDSLFRRIKANTALEGRSLREFITTAVTHELEQDIRAKVAGRRVTLPLVPSDHPGSVRITADAIGALLTAEDLDALA